MAEPIIKKDERGNTIYVKTAAGVETWSEYDENNRQIRFRNSAGFEHKREFDKFGNLSRLVDNEGTDRIWERNEQGQLIHYKDVGNQNYESGYEEWREYDERGNLIHTKNSRPYEEWWEYDENNNNSRYWDSDGINTHTEWTAHKTLPSVFLSDRGDINHNGKGFDDFRHLVKLLNK